MTDTTERLETKTEHRLTPSELKEFWLGKVAARHDVAGIEVIQYHPRLTMGGGMGGRLSSRYSTKATLYATAYVEGFNRSFESLAEAVVYVGLRLAGYGPNEAPTLTDAMINGVEAN